MDINEYIQSGVIESYVLGLASAEEVAELEALCMHHAEVRQAVERFEQAMQTQLQQQAVLPPVEIKQQLMNKLADEFAAPEVKTTPPSNDVKNPQTPAIKGKVVQLKAPNFWRNVAAAAVLLFLVSAGGDIYYYSNYNSYYSKYNDEAGKYQALLAERNTLQAANDDYHQALNIIQDSIVHVVRMPGVQGKENNQAIVYWDTRTKDVYIYAHSLQQAPQGKQYQLWALVDGKPVDAGVIGDCNVVCKMKNIPRAQAFAITLEKEGGSKEPDLKAMYVLGKV